MKDRAKEIFITAKAYSNAAKCINQEIQRDDSLFLPSQVNASLALELYFKSLYFIENDKDFKINGRFSHNFYKIFEELSENQKNSLEQIFTRIMNQRGMNDVSNLESASGIKIPLDLAENLKSWSNVFVKMRYIFDNNRNSQPMMFFPEIEQAIKEIIFNIKPEFKTY